MSAESGCGNEKDFGGGGGDVRVTNVRVVDADRSNSGGASAMTDERCGDAEGWRDWNGAGRATVAVGAACGGRWTCTCVGATVITLAIQTETVRSRQRRVIEETNKLKRPYVLFWRPRRAPSVEC